MSIHTLRSHRPHRARHRLLARPRPRHRRGPGRTPAPARSQRRRLRRGSPKRPPRCAQRGYAVDAAAFDVTRRGRRRRAPSTRFDADGIEIDILVNNAGIQFRKPMVELATADWQRVIDTNLTSAFVVGREAAKRMIPRGRGKIINIGSLTSELARATVAPYTVAKGGIKMLTRAMAAEWAEHGIQANAIGPGYMLTDMNQALIDNPTFDAWVKGRTPAGRWGKPDELVGAAVFLASAASDYVNGQIIYVDGGMVSVL